MGLNIFLKLSLALQSQNDDMDLVKYEICCSNTNQRIKKKDFIYEQT